MNIFIIVAIILLIKILYNYKENFQVFNGIIKDGFAYPYYNQPTYSNYHWHKFYNLNRFHDQYYPSRGPIFDD